MSTDGPGRGAEAASEGAAGDASAAESYATAMAELEGLLAALERDDLDVDALAERVARAAELVRYCRGRIRSADERVREIMAGLEDDPDADA